MPRGPDDVPTSTQCACGVAFFPGCIRAASPGGIAVGSHSDEAILMTAQTTQGAVAPGIDDGQHPEPEIDNVTTRPGWTIAGLNEMGRQGLGSAPIKGIVTSAENAARSSSDRAAEPRPDDDVVSLHNARNAKEDSMIRPSLTTTLALCVLAVAAATGAYAQTVLDLPRASQAASITQRVGLTTIEIRYSRPVAHGRKIWGALVPYGEVWRAGANENTTFSVEDDVTIDGEPLPKGIYGLHMIPTEKDWTVIFSKNATSWGSFTYDPAEDALRVTVTAVAAEPREDLTYEINDVQADSAVVTLRWERLAVPFKVGVNTDAVVAASIKRQLRAWSRWNYNGWDEAANYLLDHHMSAEDALAYADHSISVEERFDNLMTRSRALTTLDRKADADAVTERAMAIGDALQIHSYARGLQQQGKQEEAFRMFRLNQQRFPQHWVVHSEVARMACAKGDFATAVTEMKAAAAAAPRDYKAILEGMVRRLEAREDINK
jgi:hypothetical protein